MDRRVAAIADATTHVGPDLALALAARGHDLVLGRPRPGLVAEARAHGIDVEAIEELPDLCDPSAVRALVGCAFERFGRLDAACIRTGRIITGSLLEASLQDLRELTAANLEAVFHALQALLPPMIEAARGQIVIVTSATGARAEPTAALYSATRAAANMLVRNAALAVAGHGVNVNAIGTNFLDYPGFRAASGADDAAARARIEARVPLRRLGEPSEVAHFAASLLDGSNRFQTGQFFSLSGGWSE